MKEQFFVSQLKITSFGFSLCKKIKILDGITLLNREFSSCRKDLIIRWINAAHLRNDVYFYKEYFRNALLRDTRLVEADI